MVENYLQNKMKYVKFINFWDLKSQIWVTNIEIELG